MVWVDTLLSSSHLHGHTLPTTAREEKRCAQTVARSHEPQHSAATSWSPAEASGPHPDALSTRTAEILPPALHPKAHVAPELALYVLPADPGDQEWWKWWTWQKVLQTRATGTEALKGFRLGEWAAPCQPPGKTRSILPANPERLPHRAPSHLSQRHQGFACRHRQWSGFAAHLDIAEHSLSSLCLWRCFLLYAILFLYFDS